MDTAKKIAAKVPWKAVILAAAAAGATAAGVPQGVISMVGAALKALGIA